MQKLHAIILAAGNFDTKYLENFDLKNSLFIVLDGAANQLQNTNYCPDYIIGDFDSIDQDTLSFFNHKTQLIKNPDQDTTDLEKALIFIQQFDVQKITILGAAQGERTDHLLYNLSLLKKFYQLDQTLEIHQDQEIFCFLKDKNFSFLGQKNEVVALFGAPKAQINSKGLVWELKDYPVIWLEQSSACNRILNEKVELNVQGEIFLIRPNSIKKS